VPGQREKRMSTTYRRSEKKYLPGANRYYLTLSTVKKCVPVYMFEKNRPVTAVRTTYFDNETFDTYYDWLNREPIRYKVRYREYGYDGKFPEEVWMELKIRNYSISQKKRFKIKREHLQKFTSGKDVLKEVLKENKESRNAVDAYTSIQGYIVSNRLRPILVMEYNRMSFQPSEDSDVRITLDKDITVRNLLTGRVAKDERVVLETKVSGPRTPVWLDGLLEELGTTRAARFSKFALGMERLFLQQEQSRNNAPRKPSASGKAYSSTP
jgi:hypothetical protein